MSERKLIYKLTHPGEGLLALFLRTKLSEFEADARDEVVDGFGVLVLELALLLDPSGSLALEVRLHDRNVGLRTLLATGDGEDVAHCAIERLL